MAFSTPNFIKKTLKKIQNKSHYFSDKSLLHNVWVLYFFVFLSALFILFFSASKNLSAILVFFLTGFVASFWTKNMIVVLFFATLVSGIFGSLLTLNLPYLGGSVFEGMTDEEDASGNDVSGNKPSSSQNKVSETDKKHTEKGDGVPEGSAVKRLLSDNDQINKTVTSLLGQISGGSTLGEGDSHSQQIERLKLQSNILDKINQLEPFMNSLAKITETYNSYSPGK